MWPENALWPIRKRAQQNGKWVWSGNTTGSNKGFNENDVILMTQRRRRRFWKVLMVNHLASKWDPKMHFGQLEWEPNSTCRSSFSGTNASCNIFIWKVNSIRVLVARKKRCGEDSTKVAQLQRLTWILKGVLSSVPTHGFSLNFAY